MNTNIGNILDMPSSEVTFPKLPVGTYVGVVMGAANYGASAKKGTKFVEFQIKFFEAMEDVDPDELEDFGSIADVQMPITFYYETEGGFRRLMAFLENCGIDDDNRKLRQRIEDAGGKTVGVVVKHETSQDQMSIRAKIDGSVKVGE